MNHPPPWLPLKIQKIEPRTTTTTRTINTRNFLIVVVVVVVLGPLPVKK